ncbi:MAG: twin-arginine translocase TatA/TatE family subunit [Geothrix sp.]|nr:twin-arginine translocase TatA/TatE family subunit [Geothrix sp.]
MNLGPGHLLLIGVALLIFFGPSRLPELGKGLGKGIQEFKKASKALQGDL